MASPHVAALIANETPYSREEFSAWLTASCQRQQVPLTITNPTVLSTIAVLLR
ncbi:hypothetical protein ABQF35_11370 [Mycobacterium syngnathidarum]